MCNRLQMDTTTTGDGRKADCRVVGIDMYNQSITGEKAATLGVNCGMATGRNGVLVLNDQGGQ